MHALEDRVGAALERNRQQHAGIAAGRDHRVGVGQRQRHGLLDQHMLTGARRRQRLGGVLAAGRADADRVDVIARQERVDAGLAWHAELRGGLGGAAGVLAADRREPRPRRALDRRGVVARDHARADDPEADL